MSTGQSVKSTGGSNKSSMGANERMMNTDGNPHPGPSSLNAGSHPCTPEWTMGMGNTGGIESIKGGNFMGSDAAHEMEVKHPDRKYDPACKC